MVRSDENLAVERQTLLEELRDRYAKIQDREAVGTALFERQEFDEYLKSVDSEEAREISAILGEFNHASEIQRDLTATFKYEEVQAPGLNFLNRNGGVNIAVEKAGIDASGNVQRQMKVAVFDFTKFRLQDFAESREGIRAADVVINKGALVLKKAAIAFNETLKARGQVVPFRIGGDEKGILLLGDISPEEQDIFIQFVKEELNKVETFYAERRTSNQAEIQKGNLESTVEIIAAPEDEALSRIFYQYFSRGLLLDQEQLGKVRGNGHIALTFEDQNTANEIAGFIDSINYDNFSEFYPGLKRLKDLADSLVQGLEDDKVQDFQNMLVDSIKNRFFDKLTRIRTFTMAYAKEALETRSDEYYSVHVHDEKFIKETNRVLAYSVSDQLREALEMSKIRQIAKVVGGIGNVSSHVEIVLRGGTSLTLVKKSDNPELDERIASILEGTDHVDVISLDGEDRKAVKVDVHRSSHRMSEGRVELGDFLNKSDDIFYSGIAQNLLEKIQKGDYKVEEVLDAFRQTESKKRTLEDLSSRHSLTYLSEYIFSRPVERSAAIARSLEQLSSEANVNVVEDGQAVEILLKNYLAARIRSEVQFAQDRLKSGPVVVLRRNAA